LPSFFRFNLRASDLASGNSVCVGMWSYSIVFPRLNGTLLSRWSQKLPMEVVDSSMVGNTLKASLLLSFLLQVKGVETLFWFPALRKFQSNFPVQFSLTDSKLREHLVEPDQQIDKPIYPNWRKREEQLQMAWSLHLSQDRWPYKSMVPDTTNFSLLMRECKIKRDCGFILRPFHQWRIAHRKQSVCDPGEANKDLNNPKFHSVLRSDLKVSNIFLSCRKWTNYRKTRWLQNR